MTYHDIRYCRLSAIQIDRDVFCDSTKIEMLMKQKMRIAQWVTNGHAAVSMLGEANGHPHG